MGEISKIRKAGVDYPIKDTTARTQLAGKQDKLVSGTNIKTINGQPILGSGNIAIAGGTDTGGEATDLKGFDPQSAGYVKAMQVDMNERPTVCGYPMAVIGKGAPDFTPDFIGQMYIDSEGGKIYVSVNVENAGGFKVLN